MDLKHYLEQLKQKEKKRYRHQLKQPNERWLQAGQNEVFEVAIARKYRAR